MLNQLEPNWDGVLILPLFYMSLLIVYVALIVHLRGHSKVLDGIHGIVCVRTSFAHQKYYISDF